MKTLLGKTGQLVTAFRQVARAIDWWYYGPGKFIHFGTGPHEYSDEMPFCCAGPQCLRCRQAILARAVEKHIANRRANFPHGIYDRYDGPRVRTRKTLEVDHESKAVHR